MLLLGDDYWNLKVSQSFVLNSGAFSVPNLINFSQEFYNQSLAIKLTTIPNRGTWIYAGKLIVVKTLFGEELTVKSFDLQLNKTQLLTIPLLDVAPYFLIYQSPKWFDNVNLTLWEYNQMGVFSELQSLSAAATTANATTVTVSNQTTAALILAANTSRKGYSIRNKSNRAVYLGFSASFSANNAFLQLPANTVYESEKPYVGEVYGLAIAINSSADLVITEFV